MCLGIFDLDFQVAKLDLSIIVFVRVYVRVRVRFCMSLCVYNGYISMHVFFMYVIV